MVNVILHAHKRTQSVLELIVVHSVMVINGETLKAVNAIIVTHYAQHVMVANIINAQVVVHLLHI